MLPGILTGSPVSALEQTIMFTQARHNVLAGNIANMDTPGYRIRDLSPDNFQEKLREALDAQKEPRSAAEMPMVDRQDQAMREVKESTRDILYHDLSDLSLEKQTLAISKNEALHNTAIALLTSQYRMLNTAITERV